MQDYLDSLVTHPEQEELTLGDLFYGDCVSDDIEIYDWEER